MYATDPVFQKQVDDLKKQKNYNLLVGPGENPEVNNQ